jgi:hypothetical protein
MFPFIAIDVGFNEVPNEDPKMLQKCFKFYIDDVFKAHTKAT